MNKHMKACGSLSNQVAQRLRFLILPLGGIECGVLFFLSIPILKEYIWIMLSM